MPQVNTSTVGTLTTQRIALAGLACLILAFWVLIHPYRGIEHDSVLYAVLALSRLHPAALGHDLFVRYGTQDSFTVFSPIFAGAIREWGLEPAAAVLTFITHVAFFAAAWLLARRLMPAGLALLAVGLVVVVPAWYGSNFVFAYIESFLTPRQCAEACVLAGLTAALCSRQWLAGLCMLLAMLLHPIIAAAGVTTWIILVPGMAQPRRALIVALALAAALVLLSLTGLGPFKHFDAAWHGILTDRLAYLFPTEWRITEWVTTAVHASVLVVCIGFTRNEPVRRLSIAVLIAVALGMLFEVIESDLLHVVIAAQLQTWRWLWLLGVTSTLVLPVIAIDCWQSGDLGRAAAVALLGAMLIPTSEVAALPALFACLVTLGASRVRAPLLPRLLLAAAACLLLLSVTVVAVDLPHLLPQLQSIRAGRRLYIVRIQEVQGLAYAGLLPAAIIALAYAATLRATRRSAGLLAGLAALLLLSVVPYSVEVWTHHKYSAERVQAFAPWRDAIPESAEVVWPDPPPAEWFELGRASYWSLYQMAGMVFSRDVTMVATSRETAVTPLLPALGRTLTTERHYAQAKPGPEAQPSATGLCRVHGVAFYASWVDVGPTPYPPVAPDADRPQDLLYLYRCGAYRH